MPTESVLYQKGYLEKPLVLLTGKDNMPLHLILMTARSSCFSSSIAPCHFPKKGNSCNGHHSISKGAQDKTVPFMIQVHDPAVIMKYTPLLYVLLLLENGDTYLLY